QPRTGRFGAGGRLHNGGSDLVSRRRFTPVRRCPRQRRRIPDLGLRLPVTPPGQDGREPSTGLAHLRLLATLVPSSDRARLLLRPRRSPPATPGRTTKPGAGESDHWTLGGAGFPCGVICGHGAAD
ncbi:MAG TPA: hypothetical protein VGL88_15065, partial [Pseudonocardiaceae bacterium]